MELFYAQPQNIEDDAIFLDRFEEKHLLKTLRKKRSDIVDITDGIGNWYVAEIRDVKPQLKLKIIKVQNVHLKNRPLTLAVGYIRQNRMEFIIEKGTELGINEFILFRSQYCNHFSKNKERFDKILRQAMKQSLQFYLPKITILNSFNEFIAYSQKYKQKIAGFTEKDQPIHKYLAEHKKIEDTTLFVVGPEGGFTEEEGLTLVKNGFVLVSLGKTRLRTETAAIVGTAVIQFYSNN